MFLVGINAGHLLSQSIPTNIGGFLLAFSLLKLARLPIPPSGQLGYLKAPLNCPPKSDSQDAGGYPDIEIK